MPENETNPNLIFPLSHGTLIVQDESKVQNTIVEIINLLKSVMSLFRIENVAKILRTTVEALCSWGIDQLSALN